VSVWEALVSARRAGTDDALRRDVAALEERVAEIERSSGHWQVQINDVEEDVLLLEDRVEAHRLSLERRGMMQARTRDELPDYEPPPREPDYSYLSELPVQRLQPDDGSDDSEQDFVAPDNDESDREVSGDGGDAPGVDNSLSSVPALRPRQPAPHLSPAAAAD
jgi:ribosomal protein S18 acetylase RimI-like enzyme